MANKTPQTLRRLLEPIRHPHGLRGLGLPWLYLRFVKDLRRYRKMGGIAPFGDLTPMLFDQDPSTQSGGGMYFFQDIWALRKLASSPPSEHHDIGSRLDGFVGQLTAICPVIYWDIRPPSFKLPRFEFKEGSVLSLPVADRSLASLSCLNVAEHIGLGRFGDPLDPAGTDKTMAELSRVLAVGGRLLFSMPVGVERTQFNSQRIWPPRRPFEKLDDLELIEFSAVNDAGEFLPNVSPDDVADQILACGLYEFRRPATT